MNEYQLTDSLLFYFFLYFFSLFAIIFSCIDVRKKMQLAPLHKEKVIMCSSSKKKRVLSINIIKEVCIIALGEILRTSKSLC